MDFTGRHSSALRCDDLAVEPRKPPLSSRPLVVTVHVLESTTIPFVLPVLASLSIEFLSVDFGWFLTRIGVVVFEVFSQAMVCLCHFVKRAVGLLSPVMEFNRFPIAANWSPTTRGWRSDEFRVRNPDPLRFRGALDVFS